MLWRWGRRSRNNSLKKTFFGSFLKFAVQQIILGHCIRGWKVDNQGSTPQHVDMALTLERINNLINRSDRTKDFRTANIINSLTDPDTNIFQHGSIKAAKTIHFPHQSKADFPHNLWKDLSFSLFIHSRSFSRSDFLKCRRQPPYPVQTTLDPPSPSSPSIPTHSG